MVGWVHKVLFASDMPATPKEVLTDLLNVETSLGLPISAI